jgi:glycosyltransferase involved in cell wall biosynthesis
VPPEHSEALASAVARLAADRTLRERLGALGRERVRAFEWGGLALRVRDEYLAAIASRRGEIAARKHVLASARTDRAASEPR